MIFSFRRTGANVSGSSATIARTFGSGMDTKAWTRSFWITAKPLPATRNAGNPIRRQSEMRILRDFGQFKGKTSDIDTVLDAFFLQIESGIRSVRTTAAVAPDRCCSGL
jgi:hypothetical protein